MTKYLSLDCWSLLSCHNWYEILFSLIASFTSAFHHHVIFRFCPFFVNPHTFLAASNKLLPKSCQLSAFLSVSLICSLNFFLTFSSFNLHNHVLSGFLISLAARCFVGKSKMRNLLLQESPSHLRHPSIFLSSPSHNQSN